MYKTQIYKLVVHLSSLFEMMLEFPLKITKICDNKNLRINIEI